MKMQYLSQGLFFTLILILFSACTPSNKKPPKGLEGAWLSVSSEYGPKSSSGLMDGYFMKIESGLRKYQFAYSDIIVNEDCTFTDSSIVYKDSNNILIPYMGKDSMRLFFEKGNIKVTYLKLPFQKSSRVNIKTSDLTENEWYLIDEENKHRVDFIDHDFELLNYDKSFKLGHNIRGWGEHSGWDLIEFDGYQYLISTAISIFEPDVYQITEFQEDTIGLKFWDTWGVKDFKDLKLVKSPAKSIEAYQEMKNRLINHQFKLAKYQFESHYSDNDWDTTILKRINHFFTEYGIKKEMTFSFTQDSLYIANTIGEYAKGAWSLSKDLKCIKAIIENDPYHSLVMEIELGDSLYVDIHGFFGNINQIYNGHQIERLQLDLVSD